MCFAGAFFFQAQFDHAREIIRVPLAHFVKFAQDLGDPDPEVNIVLLSNTGR